MRIPATLLSVAALATGFAHAQCSTFANNPPGANLLLTDDSVRTVGIGFPFVFDGVTYDTITICSNGFVWLGTVDPNGFNGLANNWFDNEQDFRDLGPRISVGWDDWNPGAPGGGVYFATNGTSSASVTWKAVPRLVGLGALNAELVLTSTNDFYIKYDASMASPSDTCLVGITRGGGVAANAVDWSAAIPLSVPNCTGYERFLAGLFDLSGQTLHFAPTSPAATSHTVQFASLSTCPPGNYPPLASTPISHGVGCPGAGATNPSALYELFTPGNGANPTDMSGRSIKFLKAGTSYVTQPGPGLDLSYTTGTVHTQFDETVVRDLSFGPMLGFPFANIVFPRVDAAANGYLLLQGGNSDFSPTSLEFMTGGARIAPHWTDYDFTGGGTFYWNNSDPAFCMATWENVEMYAQPGTSNTFQCKLMANGDIVFSYGAVASAYDDVLVGISLANGGTDPGSSDLSAAITTPLVHDLGSLTLPLTLSISGPASIATTVQLAADNLNGGVLGAFVLGYTATDIDLTNIGMPGCWTYCTIDEVYVLLSSGGRLLKSFLVPGNPILFGVTVHTQAAVFTPVNPFGLISSNRYSVTLGL